MQIQSSQTAWSAFLLDRPNSWRRIAATSDTFWLFRHLTAFPQLAERRTITVLLDQTEAEPATAPMTSTIRAGWSLCWHDGWRWQCRIIGAPCLAAMEQDFEAVLTLSPKEIRIIPPGEKIPYALN